MKIVFLGGNFNNSGGTERVASVIANELSRSGHEVVLASMVEGNTPFFPLESKVSIVSVLNGAGRILYRVPSLIRGIRRLLIEEKADVLIVVESMSVLYTAPATVGLPIKHICWEHFNYNIDLGQKGRRLARHMAAWLCDVVVTLTEQDKEYWLKHTRHRAQITTIPNPSPFPVKNVSLNTESKVVLAAGRLTYQKGFDLLLLAWKKVNNSYPDWKLHIVGDGEDKNALENSAAEYGISGSVEFVGNKQDMEKYYQKSAIYCLSSRFEGFGMVLVEAMSYGLPIVSFNCELGPSEILSGTDSRLIPVGDTDELANSLIELMADEKERERLSRQSEVKAKQYQPDKIIGQWLEVIV
ncbi:glycosyltransferase family 4 protein [Zobellella maritima]|uniref:glycosyltransferase family 4 protein n=1 Tax=Zobellella maritima TaxID=2059725 RepID=UPI000E2FF60C|nr:glycosyltransferase family 4 protein [Zobellella maritima]